MNSNAIQIGPLVTMSAVNSGSVDFSPLASGDTVYSNTEPVSLGGSPVSGAKVLIFEQRVGDLVGDVNSSSYVVAMATTNVNGMWSVNVEAFTNFDPLRRYAFYLWYEVGDISYSAPIVIAGTGGNITVNHAPLTYQEPMEAARIWFNAPAIPVGYREIVSAEKESGELKEHKFYEKRRGILKKVFPIERIDTPFEIVSVTINQPNTTITVGNTVQLSATVVSNGTGDTSITWFSADTSIATVGLTTGLVTAIAPGQVGITARSVFDETKSDDNIVTVNAVTATFDSQEGDQIALQDVYNSTDGANWKNSTGWSSSINLSTTTPFGVEKAEIGGQWRVTSLILRSNDLTGTLPESLGNLKKCVWLITKDNFITGQAPVNISKMTELKYLYLSGSVADPSLDDSGLHPGKTSPETNTFAGSTLPPEWGQLPNIEIIEFAQSQVEGALPAEWGQMSTLRKLYLNGSRVEGGWPGGNITGPLPPEWSGMTSMMELTIGDNLGLSGTLPPSWHIMPMRNFRLASHGVQSEIPSSWSAWGTQLRLFVARGARATGRLSGNVPAWFYDGGAPIMHTASLSYNNFNRIDIADNVILPYAATQVMSYSYSGLTQGFPNWIKRSKNMQIMSFSGGDMVITGSIDDDFFYNYDTDANVWRRWDRIRNFRFDGQPLGGTLPSSFGSSVSSSLTVSIRLNGCGIGGIIPANWANFKANGIIEFRLQSNDLHGPIPVGIAGWTNIAGNAPAWRSDKEGFNISANRFTYSDLIPLINAWPAAPLSYGSQKDFPVDDYISPTQTPAAGSTLALNLSGIDITGNVYQWRKDGVNLVNGGRVSGATTHTLQITTADISDNADYTLRITNANAPSLAESISEPITVQLL